MLQAAAARAPCCGAVGRHLLPRTASRLCRAARDAVTRLRLVRVRRTCAAGAPCCRRIGRHELTGTTRWLRDTRHLAMRRARLVLVCAARSAHARLRRAVRRDLLPGAAVRLRHTSAAREVVALVARLARRAAVRRARDTSCHGAMLARRTLLQLALAVTRRCRGNRLVLRRCARGVGCTCTATVVSQRWRNLHVFRTRAHVHRRTLAVD